MKNLGVEVVLFIDNF